MARRSLGQLARWCEWLWLGVPLLIGCVPTPNDKPATTSTAPDLSARTESTAVPDAADDARSSGHKLPTNYADGVRRVRELRDTLREGWKGEDHEKVHEPLHELAPLLLELPKLLDKETRADDDQAETRAAIHELFRLFGQVDAKLHSGFGASYDDVAEAIDAALDKLQPPPGPRAP